MALVVLSVVEQRLDAARAVLAGAQVSEVAARVSEMRREHPRWGSRRIRLELLRRPGPWQRGEVAVPSERTIDRILIRSGLVRARKAKRPRESFTRFERPGPMQLWGIDIVGGIQLINPGTGEIREAKIVTGIDDHSRFCVMAEVVERATGRAVCVAFAQALARYGVPEEVITDNGKQFTDRFSRYGPSRGEVLFDKICRRNGITHRLTQPGSPNQNGKVERFHGTFRPEISEAGPFPSLQAAQMAVESWVTGYNTDRPHQALDERVPVMPADRFQPAPAAPGLEVWVPPSLEAAPAPESAPAAAQPTRPRAPGSGEAIELDRPVPASGNMALCGNQFWLGSARAGQVVRFWIDCDWVHLSIGGQQIKSLRSRFTVTDLDTLTAQGATPAGPPPVSSRGGPGARAGRTIVEVERTVARTGLVSLGSRMVLAAEILAGRRVGIYIEDSAPLLFFDPATRELLRTRPNPLAPGEASRLQRQRPVGPVPRPTTDPVTVQRRASNTGVITVAGQRVALGRQNQHQTVTVHVSDTTVAIDLPEGDTMTVRRTTDQPVRSIKGQRPRTANREIS